MFLNRADRAFRDSDHDALVRRPFPYMGVFIAAFVALDLVSVVVVLVAL